LVEESRWKLIAFFVLALLTALYLAWYYPIGDSRPATINEAFYEALKLLTFQSELPFPNGDWLGVMIFFSVPLIGLALIFQSVLNFGKLLLDKSERPEKWQIALASTYRNHIIVCGLGRVGFRVAEQLRRAGYEVVAIERDWENPLVERLLAQKIPVIRGNASDTDVLRRAGILYARAVFTALSDDVLNLEIALAARSIRPTIRVVLRIFNEDVDRNLEETFGSNSAFSASALAAPTMAAATISRDIDYVLPISGTLIGISRLTIQPESKLTGRIRQIEEQYRVRVLMIRATDGTAMKRKRPEAVQIRPLSGGDQVTFLGPIGALSRLRDENRRGTRFTFLRDVEQLSAPTPTANTVIVCGLGRKGFRTVQKLQKLPHPPQIVVIREDDDADRPFLQRLANMPDIEYVTGDARQREVLTQAKISQAYALIAVTPNDLFNEEISWAARKLQPEIEILLGERSLQSPNGQFDTVIVCGLGKVGYRVIRQLWTMSPRPRIAFIHLNDKTEKPFLQRIKQLDDVIEVVGDAREPGVLQKAGIDRAYSVAALTADDSVNLQIGLAAKRLRAEVHMVMRVFSDPLAERLPTLFEIHTAYSTSAIASATFAAASAIGDVRHAFVANDQLFASDSILVSETHPLYGQKLEALSQAYGTVAIAVRRDEQTIPLPDLDLILKANDIITLLAPLEELRAFRRELRNLRNSTFAKPNTPTKTGLKSGMRKQKSGQP
jgi:Trk K+ transport system NAD-binding subunit